LLSKKLVRITAMNETRRTIIAYPNAGCQNCWMSIGDMRAAQTHSDLGFSDSGSTAARIALMLTLRSRKLLLLVTKLKLSSALCVRSNEHQRDVFLEVFVEQRPCQQSLQSAFF